MPYRQARGIGVILQDTCKTCLINGAWAFVIFFDDADYLENAAVTLRGTQTAVARCGLGTFLMMGAGI